MNQSGEIVLDNLIVNADVYIENQKLVLFRVFQNFWQLEKALNILASDISSKLEVSVLGKFSKIDYEHIDEAEQEILNVEMKMKELFNPSVDFGYFQNYEIGRLYIAGSLTPIFLYKINEEPLGVLSTGPYGILRGLGAEEKQTRAYFRFLNNGSNLLIIRGYDYDLYDIENRLGNLHTKNIYI